MGNALQTDLQASYRFGRLEVCPATRQLLADGKQVAVGARAFSVLLALIERRERVVTKEELLELAWPGVIVAEANLQVQMSMLRKLLVPRAIATIPGRGYQFVCSLDGEAAPRLAGRSWRTSIFAAVFLAIASSGIGLWFARDGIVQRSISQPEAQALQGNSIAVLPFSNLSEDKDTTYFADGLHDDLIRQLALLGELRVVSRTSVMDYRNTKKNMRQIGAELAVGTLLEGSVRRTGAQVRVSVQLIDARSDRHLWAKTYDRELKDLFTVQSEVATEIAKALKVSLTPREQMHLVRRPTEHIEAYDLFLRYQDLVNRSTGSVRLWSGINDRVALLSKAVEIDPKFALAWAHLGAQHALAYAVNVEKTALRQTQAKEAMSRALALAPDDLLVKTELGTYYYLALRDDQKAAAVFEEVLQRVPHNIEALTGLGIVYHRFQGRSAEAVALLDRALIIDPRNMRTLMLLTMQHRAFRQFDRALAYQQQMVNIRPDDLDLQADYQRSEYRRSGSWTEFDRWRAGLPATAHLKYSRVIRSDIERAIARRDFDGALQLIEAIPEDSRGSVNLLPYGTCCATPAGVTLARAGLYYAKGARGRAMELARSGIQQFETALERTPNDPGLWTGKSILHAMLKERDLAFAVHAKAVAVAAEQKNVPFAMEVQFASPGIHALLGDRQTALAGLSKLLKFIGLPAHAVHLDTTLASLWNDPQFLALLNDPANNAPIPFHVNNSHKLVKY